jgi:hypothetical protein
MSYFDIAAAYYYLGAGTASWMLVWSAVQNLIQ